MGHNTQFGNVKSFKVETSNNELEKYRKIAELDKFSKDYNYTIPLIDTKETDKLKMQRRLEREFPKAGEKKISDILTFFFRYSQKNTGKHIYEVASIALEKKLTADEMHLIKIVFNSDLESASRGGISIINKKGSIEVRNGIDKKFLDEDEKAELSTYLFNTV